MADRLLVARAENREAAPIYQLASTKTDRRLLIAFIQPIAFCDVTDCRGACLWLFANGATFFAVYLNARYTGLQIRGHRTDFLGATRDFRLSRDQGILARIENTIDGFHFSRAYVCMRARAGGWPISSQTK